MEIRKIKDVSTLKTEETEIRFPPDVEDALYYGINTFLTGSQRENITSKIASGNLDMTKQELIDLVRSKRRFIPKP